MTTGVGIGNDNPTSPKVGIGITEQNATSSINQATVDSKVVRYDVVDDIDRELNDLQIENSKREVYRDIARNKARVFKTSCVRIDQKALDVLNSINAIKTQVVALGSTVISPSASCYTPSTQAITDRYAPFISGVATAYAANLGLQGVTGLGTTSVIAYGTVTYDALQALYYPQLESSTGETTTNAQLELVYSGASYVNVTSNNIGIGASDKFVVNGGAVAGRVFLVGTCGNAAAGVALTSSYENLKVGIQSHASASTKVKSRKTQYQIHYWAHVRKNNENDASAQSLQNTKNELNKLL